MKKQKRSVAISIAVILIAVAFTALPAMAQEITGELGSPSTTTTISGKQLPAPEPKDVTRIMSPGSATSSTAASPVGDDPE